MYSIRVRAIFAIAAAILAVQTSEVRAQELGPGSRAMEADPCGYPDLDSQEYKMAALQNWGYGYDSLLSDLVQWDASPFVRVDSVGASVQNRALYMLTIQDTTTVATPRERVWVHARTHPNEVQGTWVTNELIELLLSEDPLGRLMRERCIINIVPMYNPDGVELGYGRENANGVDIESNWDKPVLEPEVQVLKGLFETFMAEPNPIRVALNMHSAWDCSRYFVYHAASGTSASYALLEQEYIGYVRAPFPSRIKPYNYFVSWNNSAPLRYPESWFWYNHGEAVMALTYEDMNCSAAGGFDTTAMALLQGTADYLGITGGPTGVTVTASAPREFRLLQNYPNPFNPSTTIEYSLPRAAHATVKVYNLLGSEVATLVDEARPAGVHRLLWDAGNAPSGVYLYMIRAGDYIETRRAILIR